jgi:hypothetical protein
MKKIITILLMALISTSAFAAIPSEPEMREFLNDLSIPFGVTSSGGIYNTSFYSGGIPHFNIDMGVTSSGAEIKNPEGQGDMKTTFSIFHLKGIGGLFKGFQPTSSWAGFLGLEVGAKLFTSPMFGGLNESSKGYPYGFSVLSKVNLLKNKNLTPALSFTFEYNSLLNGEFRFHDFNAGEVASCTYSISSLFYHIDIRERVGLVYLYSGFGWLSPSLKGTYTISNRETDFTSSDEGTLTKYYLGLSVPIELIDANLEIGKSETLGYFGASLGFRM